MINASRLAPAIVMAAALVWPGTPAQGQGLSIPLSAPVVMAQELWDGLRTGTFGMLDYGAGALRSMTGWLTGGMGGGGGTDTRVDDVRGLLSLSDKEFRDFESLVRAAGYGLQGYSFGLNGGSEVELSFDLERVITDREREDLRRQVDQQNGAASPVRRNIILGLLEASRYSDASPASGYRLAGVVMRLGAPPDVRVRFRRAKP